MERQTRSFFFLVVIFFSAADEVKRELVGKVGGNVTLPGAVSELGFLLKNRKTLAMVVMRELKIVEEMYEERLLWDKSTESFTLIGLKKNDSGIYTIDSKRRSLGDVAYRLTVYDAVPTPKVMLLNVSTESCSLLCSVDKADEETTLLWHKHQEMRHIRNSSSASLPLVLNIRQDLSSLFFCVAKNPAENKTVSVNVESICGKNTTSDNGTERRRHYYIPWMAFSIGFVLLVILTAFVICWKYVHYNKTAAGQTQETEPEVQYTEVHICADRRSKGGHLPESQGNVDQSNLRTVYDQLEVRRMVPPDPTEPV